MWKKYILFSVLTIFVLLSACSLKSNEKNSERLNNNKKLSDKQWIEDIDYLYKELPKRHINIYHSLKEETFKFEIEKLKKDVPKLNDYEIQCKIAQIVALIGDAHTSANINFGGEDNKVYLVKLKWFGEDLRIDSVEKNKKDILGMKVKYINNGDIGNVMKKINSLISHENEQWLKSNNINGLMVEEILKALGMVINDKLELSLEDENSNVKKVELEPLVYNNINRADFVSFKNEIDNKPIGWLNNDKPYWYKYIEEEKLLYLQYNQCFDYDSAKRIGYKNYEDYPKFNEFSNEFLNELKNKEVDKLIVDLRNNVGGTSELMESLVREVNKIDKLKGEGKVLALIGKNTFSSGVIAAVDLKEKLNAILIGEPTGGNANGYGEIASFKLPNSKTEITCSTKYVKCANSYDKNVIPDIKVNETFENYKKGIDEVYEAAKNYKIKN